MKEAGADVVQELAYTFANAVTYVRSVLDRGLGVDAFAQRLSFATLTGPDFFVEIAKFRAARRVWARVMSEWFGARDPRSLMYRVFSGVVCRALTREFPLNNIFRIGVMGLANVLGGVQALSLAGYATGPARDRPGYDYLMQALSGLMSLTGEPGLPPAKTGISIVDHLGGLFAALAILAAVVGRSETGEGRQIDLALLDCQLSLFSYLAANYLNHRAVPERQAMSAHPYVVPCQNFQASDGWFTVTAMAQKFWPPFCEAVGRPELADDPRFKSREDRYRHREPLLATLEPLFRTRPVAEWVARLEERGHRRSGSRWCNRWTSLVEAS